MSNKWFPYRDKEGLHQVEHHIHKIIPVYFYAFLNTIMWSTEYQGSLRINAEKTVSETFKFTRPFYISQREKNIKVLFNQSF